MSDRWLACLLLLVIPFAGCGDADDVVAPTGPGSGAVLRIVSGDGQSGPVSELLPEPLVVEVVDDAGTPVDRVSIAWTTTSGGGFEDGELLTDSDGRASARWRVGTVVGAHSAAVEAPLGQVAFAATALPGAPDRIEIVAGNGQAGSAGSPLPEPVTVRVTDRFDNPIPGAALTWMPGNGSTLDARDDATNAAGEGSATWRLGQVIGAYELEVAAAPGTVTIDATATSGPIATLEIVSGDGQAGEVATALGAPLVVRAVDGGGSPVAGVSLAWAAEAGTLLAAETVTGTDGQATATWQLGETAGSQVTQVFGPGGPLVFGATGTPGPAAAIQIVSGDGQAAEVTTTLPQPVVVRVADQYDNSVPGAALTWTPGGGSAVIAADPTSDANGEAAADWQLGTVATSYQLQVTANPGSVTFDAIGTPGPPDTVLLVSGDNQATVAGTDLPDPAVVEVLDEFGNPVPGVVVAWSVTSGGTASPSGSVTNAVGRASTTWTLGCLAGPQSATATVPGVGTVDFSATALEGSPGALVIVSGNNQTGVVSAVLPDPLVVRVEDACGNVLAGVDVDWVVTGGLGFPMPATSTSDASGEASTTWVLGPVIGDHTMEARVGALVAVFNATGIL